MAVGRDCGALVVDLREAVLTSPRDLSALVAALDRHAAGNPVALVCDRLSGRRLLRQTCRGTSIQVLDELPRAAAPA